MKILSTIIKNEYLLSIRKKSFMASTLLVPILFGIIIFISSYYDQQAANVDTSTTVISDSDITTAIISTSTMLLWIFLLIIGAQIFNSVKFEKSNRIVEIILSSVSPIKFLFAKIIAVGLIGLTQICIWILLLFLFFVIAFNDNNIIIVNSNPSILLDNIQYLFFGLLSFIGGYVLYGSLYAAMGSLLDADNENQTYLMIITMILLLSMYATTAIISNPHLWFADIVTFLPFTSPISLSVRISQGIPMWQILLSYIILYASAALSLFISGKIYSSGILLKGKRITFSNIITFIKS